MAHHSIRHPTELAKERSVKGEDYHVFQLGRVYRLVKVEEREVEC